MFLNDKRIETYFLMSNHFRFQKVVFYWLKPVPRPAVCFVEFLCCGKKAKRPRIEALKLQMCVMVIRPLFAPILMTDLIPVFKRPTESRRYMETDILDNICVDYFYTFFLNYYNCRFLSHSDPHEVGLEEILRCKFCQSGFSPNSWAFNVQILGN